MKLATLLLFLLVGTCMPKENNANTDYGIFTFLLRNNYHGVRSVVVAACEKNYPDIYTELRSEEIDAASCFNNSTEVDDIEKLTKCFGGLVKKTASCLNEKYLPQLLLEYSKEFLREGYDPLLQTDDFDDCRRILNTGDANQSIFDCVGAYDKGVIPPTKTKFCEALTPAAKCLVDGVKNNCEETPTANKITSRFMRIINNVCK
ncbi:hypothetical protein JTB14_011318 [Gonioctena quinquepunctata]|nr:hypothetical protein JTB14_011318 [Gonioctena quinquepunctata]